jgi:hypothetical protein
VLQTLHCFQCRSQISQWIWFWQQNVTVSATNTYRCFKSHCYATLRVVALSLRSALFWDFSQCRVVIHTDVSVQLIGPILKGQAVQLDYLTLKDWTGDVFTIRRYKLTLYTAKKSIRGQISLTSQRKLEITKVCSYWTTWPLDMGPIRCPETSVKTRKAKS